MFLYIFISTVAISVLAFTGAIFLSFHVKHLHRVLTLLVSLSAGTLLGGAFIHLLPEAHETISTSRVYLSLLAAYVLFFVMESILHLHHTHDEEDHLHHHRKSLGFMNLSGDILHNFLDGLVIASAFAVGPEIGIPTAVAVALHEIPQEISDFGVLMYSGFSKTKALVFNFLASLSVVVGGIVGYFLSSHSEGLIELLIPFAAGSFIYVATSDLVPQIKAHEKLSKAVLNLGVFVLGIGIMYALQFAEGH